MSRPERQLSSPQTRLETLPGLVPLLVPQRRPQNVTLTLKWRSLLVAWRGLERWCLSPLTVTVVSILFIVCTNQHFDHHDLHLRQIPELLFGTNMFPWLQPALSNYILVHLTPDPPQWPLLALYQLYTPGLAPPVETGPVADRQRKSEPVVMARLAESWGGQL